MPASLITTRRIEFADTDMAGIAHFTCYFRLMEEVEHELLRNLGLNVVTEDGETHVSWPRVSARCDYLGPAKFGDELEIAVAVEKITERSVTYQFSIRNNGTEIAVGAMTSVCCRITPGAPPQSIPIPAWIREKLHTE